MLIHEVITVKAAKREQQRKQRIPSAPIADQLKHDVVTRKLTARLARQQNIVKPTEHDIRVAQDRVDTMQRKANLDFKNRQDEQAIMSNNCIRLSCNSENKNRNR